MKNSQQSRVAKDQKKDTVYYLMRDILSCFPNKFKRNFLSIINYHLIAKEAVQHILKNEIKEEKPSFRIIAGALILQNSFLYQMDRVAFYEIIDIVEELNYCFKKDPRKTIKGLSGQIILRLFATLYSEYIALNRAEEGKKFLNLFKAQFSQKDIIKIFNSISTPTLRFILEKHNVGLSSNERMYKRLKEILDKFYSTEELT